MESLVLYTLPPYMIVRVALLVCDFIAMRALDFRTQCGSISYHIFESSI